MFLEVCELQFELSQNCNNGGWIIRSHLLNQVRKAVVFLEHVFLHRCLALFAVFLGVLKRLFAAFEEFRVYTAYYRALSWGHRAKLQVIQVSIEIVLLATLWLVTFEDHGFKHG